MSSSSFFLSFFFLLLLLFLILFYLFLNEANIYQTYNSLWGQKEKENFMLDFSFLSRYLLFNIQYLP
jgi:hypothetical protein